MYVKRNASNLNAKKCLKILVPSMFIFNNTPSSILAHRSIFSFHIGCSTQNYPLPTRVHPPLHQDSVFLLLLITKFAKPLTSEGLRKSSRGTPRAVTFILFPTQFLVSFEKLNLLSPSLSFLFLYLEISSAARTAKETKEEGRKCQGEVKGTCCKVKRKEID